MATKAEMRSVLKNKFLCQDKFSNDIENIFIQSNVVTINFTKNIGTAVTDFEKLIEDFFLFYGDEEE